MTAPIIDAHVHLWDPACGDYGWLTPAMPGLYRRIDKHELRGVLTRAGVHGAVLVQAAPTVAESDYLLSIAQQTPWVLGVVGWLDFDDPQVAEAIARRASQQKFVGVRPMLQDIVDADWILDPRREAALGALAKHGLVFDALIRPVHMARIRQVARRYPDLSIVIDHAAKPSIAGTLDPAWRAALQELAACSNVVCKLSGLLTEVVPGADRANVLGCARTVLQVFGASRVLWGSDWPVLTQAATYDEWYALTREVLGSLCEAERGAVLGGNAARIYRLTPKAAVAGLLLHPDDNILVCCRPVRGGERVRVSSNEEIEVRQDVQLGHKLARRSLSAGEKVIKYGAPIGSMTACVAAGEWIHLHNMKSDYISAHTREAPAGKT